MTTHTQKVKLPRLVYQYIIISRINNAQAGCSFIAVLAHGSRFALLVHKSHAILFSCLSLKLSRTLAHV